MRYLPVLVLSLLFAGCSKEPASPPEPALAATPAATPAADAIAVATDATYRPMEFMENETIVGFDIDLMKAIAKEAGMTVTFRHQEWDGILPGLIAKKYDAIISSMTITEERAKQVLFSDPYYDSYQVIVIRDGEEGIKALDDLTGKTIGVQINTTGQMKAETVADAKIDSYSTMPDAFLSLKNGSVDAVIGDAPVCRSIAAEKKGFVVIDVPLTAEQYGIAMHQDNGKLAARINKALAAVKASGTYDEIAAKWFGK